MATLPVNTLVFCGGGPSSVFRYVSPSGVDLGQPDSPPSLADGSFSIATFADGSIWSWRRTAGFPGGAKIFAPSTFADGAVIPLAAQQQHECVACDQLGNAYWVKNIGAGGAGTFDVYKTTVAGVSSLVCTSSKPGGTDVKRIAVNGAGTVAYVSNLASGTGAVATVLKVTLSGGATTTLATSTLAYGVNRPPLLVLSDDSVVVGFYFNASTPGLRRYDSSGNLLSLYTGLPDTYLNPIALAHAYQESGVSPRPQDGTQFFVMYFASGASGYGATVARVVASTGVVVSSWQPPDDGFDWGNAMTAIRVRPAGQVPIDTPEAPTIDCDPQTEVSGGGRGAAGCNTGGIGFTSVGDYDIGGIPEHDDPDAGEQISGKTGVEVWVELVHEGTTYRRAMVPLGDANEGGYKAPGLSAVGVIEHALGNERGGYEPATLSIEMSDVFDNLLRDIIAADEEIEGDELRVKVASDEMRGLF